MSAGALYEDDIDLEQAYYDEIEERIEAFLELERKNLGFLTQIVNEYYATNNKYYKLILNNDYTPKELCEVPESEILKLVGTARAALEKEEELPF